MSEAITSAFHICLSSMHRDTIGKNLLYFIHDLHAIMSLSPSIVLL